MYGVLALLLSARGDSLAGVSNNTPYLRFVRVLALFGEAHALIGVVGVVSESLNMEAAASPRHIQIKKINFNENN